MKYLLDELGRWIPEYLESLDDALMDEFGEEWPKTALVKSKEKAND